MLNSIEIKLVTALAKQKAVLLGSRRLNVQTESSDYDYAVTEASVPDEVLVHCFEATGSAQRYYDSPLLDKCSMLVFNKVQVFVCPTQKDLDKLDRAMQRLEAIDKDFTKDKDLRIALFRRALVLELW
jgi:hypothetical protein